MSELLLKRTARSLAAAIKILTIKRKKVTIAKYIDKENIGGIRGLWSFFD
jgi:hypothetical protein